MTVYVLLDRLIDMKMEALLCQCLAADMGLGEKRPGFVWATVLHEERRALLDPDDLDWDP